jgi:hypothetical protein
MNYFFATRFLGSEEQWARLVARKLSSKLPSKDDLLKKYQQLNELHGQDAAEAVFHTLTTLLTKATPKRLSGLREAIASAFWTKPFFERTDGEIVLGEPPAVPAFDFNSAYSYRVGPDRSQAALKRV